MSEMPWSLWKFDGTMLVPRSQFDLQLITDKYAVGTVLRGKFAKPRSKPQHQLYWAALQVVVDATAMWMSTEDLHEAIKRHLNMVRGIVLINGGFEVRTKSIDFNSMDQGDFGLFFKKAGLAIEESTGMEWDLVIEEAKKKCAFKQAA